MGDVPVVGQRRWSSNLYRAHILRLNREALKPLRVSAVMPVLRRQTAGIPGPVARLRIAAPEMPSSQAPRSDRFRRKLQSGIYARRLS